MESKFPDAPKSLRDPEVRAERISMLSLPHVTDLTAFVDSLRETAEGGEDIPYFDPLDGGVDAQCLCLFEAPGEGPLMSGFISRNNDDETAANFYKFNSDPTVSFDRCLTISWNIVPWALRENGKNLTPTPADRQEGLQYLPPLLDRLKKLEVAILFGENAWDAEEALSSLTVIKTNHPSPKAVNRYPHIPERIKGALRDAKRLLSA